MLTILADENIANLDDYMAHHEVRIIKLKGRDINQAAVDLYRPSALFIRSVTPINQSTLPNLSGVRFIGSATIGTDHVDGAYLQRCGIHFANAQGCSKHSVAQYVMTAVLSLRPHYALERPTLGIVGLGNIGSTLAKYAQDLNWHILGHDPYLPVSDLNNSSFEVLVKNSDIISVHTPLTKTGDYPTYQLFDKAVFAQLKPHTLLINSARGEIIHQADLLNAIDDKNLQTVLDVFPHEPSIDKVLLDKLTLVTPHIAGYTLEGKLRGTDMIYQAFCHTFHRPITQQLAPLLPPNELHWTAFKQINHKDTDAIQSFYDIRHDDASLRAVGAHGVQPADFDALRKNYALRREWHFSATNA